MSITTADFSTPALRAELDRRGYTSRPKRDFQWEKPCEFSARMGRERTWYSKRRKGLPPHEKEKGRTGRVIRIRSNPELEDFARKPEPKTKL